MADNKTDNDKAAQQAERAEKAAQKKEKAKSKRDRAPVVHFEASGEPTGPAVPARLRERYKKEIIPALMQEFGYKNPMEVPRLLKITLNMGLGEATSNANIVTTAAEELSILAGQRAVITRSKKAISNFK